MPEMRMKMKDEEGQPPHANTRLRNNNFLKKSLNLSLGPRPHTTPQLCRRRQRQGSICIRRAFSRACACATVRIKRRQRLMGRRRGVPCGRSCRVRCRRWLWVERRRQCRKAVIPRAGARHTRRKAARPRAARRRHARGRGRIRAV